MTVLREKEGYRVATFRRRKHVGLGACSRAGDWWLRSRNFQTTIRLQCLLAQVYQPLSLVFTYALYRRFTCVHHTDYLALTRFADTRRVSFLRILPHGIYMPFCYIVGVALYSDS